MLVLTARGEVLYANPAAQQMLDLQDLSALRDLPDRQPACPWGINDQAGGQGVGELRIAPIEWESQPARLVTIEDVSIRAACQSELADACEALATTRQDLDDLSFVVSHDLKAPLRGVTRLAQWIDQDLGKLKLSGSIGAEIRENLNLLVKRVDRMHEYLSSIIAYFRVESGQGEREEIDVRALLESVIPLLNAPQGFSIEILGDIPGLYGEKAPIEMLFTHLLGNAVKHHHRPTEGHVVVTARDEGDRVEYLVSDNGPGIPPEFRERVFRVFQTLQSRDRVEGAGVGLAIVKKLLRSVGGSITVDERQGDPGICFHVSLPRIMPRRTTGRLTPPRRSPMPFPRPVA